MKVLTDSELDHVARLLDQLGKVYRAQRIYGPPHLRCQQARDQYREQAERTLQLLGPERTQLQVARHDGRLFLENMPLPAKELQTSPLHEMLGTCEERCGIVLDLGSTDDDSLIGLVERLGGEGSDEAQWLSRHQVNVRSYGSNFGRSPVALFAGLDDLRVDVEFCDGILNQLASAMESFAESDSGDVAPLLRAGDELVDRFLTNAQRILPITTIPYFDHFTYHHSLNVALLTLCAAKQVMSDAERLKRVCQAALLHDLGKSRIPAEILFKPDRLTPEEIALVQRHPVEGAELLARFQGMDPLAVTVAFGHHVKDDGHGYPKVPPGFELGSVTRLVEVSDIFEALTAHRPYKESLPAAQAFEVLYSMPHMESFRPYMDMLLRSVGYHPLGSRVRTEEGQIGVVVGHRNDDPSQPIVRPLERVQRGEVGNTEDVICGAEQLVSLSCQEDEALLATA